AENADVVAVMYASRVVEYAPVEDVFERPLHPYTQGLLKSVPRLGAHSERLVSIPGTVPNPAKFPSGCKFHPRCHRTRQAAQSAAPAEIVEIRSAGETAKVLRLCAEDEPVLREVKPGHWAACHLIDNFKSAPITAPVLAHRRQVVPKAVEGGDKEILVTAKEEYRS